MELVIPTGLAVLASILSPILVEYLTASSMSLNRKTWVATLVSLVIALGWVWATGGFGVIDLAAGAPAVLSALGAGLSAAYGLQQIVFNLFFKGTKLQNKLSERGVHDPVEAEDGDTDGPKHRAEV